LQIIIIIIMIVIIIISIFSRYHHVLAVNMKLVYFEPYSVLFRQDQGCLDYYYIIKGLKSLPSPPHFAFHAVSFSGFMGYCRSAAEGE
jgi:hypothetical protein